MTKEEFTVPLYSIASPKWASAYAIPEKEISHFQVEAQLCTKTQGKLKALKTCKLFEDDHEYECDCSYKLLD